MATIKISELTPIIINSNTSNTYIVGHDVSSGVSGKLTATNFASGLYANNILNVGNTEIIFPNVVAQFAKSGASYIQVNLLNIDNGGTADYVATANTGSDTTYFIDVGYANKDFVPGSEYNSLGSSISPLDGYIYVQGKDSAPNVGGNLTIGTTTSHTKARIVVGGGTSENVITEFRETQINLNRQVRFGDGTTQNTSPAAAGLYANGAFIEANAAFGVANSASLYANGAFVEANAAFTKANNALANTTGTFAGDLTVTGNVFVKTSAKIQNASMTGNNQYLIITGTAGNAIGTPSNPGYTIHTATDSGNRIVGEAYSNTASDYAAFIGRRARGTAAAPLAVQSNDTIVRFGGNGFGSTKFSQFSDARIEFVATENHTDSARGTKIRFMNTENGTNTATEIATFNANTVSFTGTVSPTKGFIYTPRILAGSQTAITLDFSTDSIVRATFASTLTISLANYTAGKIVDVWVTNTAGNGQTVNFGILANNSTTGATSFSVAAGRSAKLQYFSIDGDQANTFLAVTYA